MKPTLGPPISGVGALGRWGELSREEVIFFANLVLLGPLWAWVSVVVKWVALSIQLTAQSWCGNEWNDGKTVHSYQIDAQRQACEERASLIIFSPFFCLLNWVPMVHVTRIRRCPWEGQWLKVILRRNDLGVMSSSAGEGVQGRHKWFWGQEMEELSLRR